MAKSIITVEMTARRLFGGGWQLGRLWDDLDTGESGMALDEYVDARSLLYALSKEMGVSVEITLLE